MDPKLIALLDSISTWWEQHEYDTFPTGDGDEDNVYRDTPEFVRLAKELEKLTKTQLDSLNLRKSADLE